MRFIGDSLQENDKSRMGIAWTSLPGRFDEIRAATDTEA
jgi:hypothetical protein